MESDLTQIHRWLLPLSWFYGAGVDIRNALFDMGTLRSVSYDIPIINVGNITVGGTGKTPHVEYLIRLLSGRYHVAVLSRGYKRKTKGYLLASTSTAMEEIGDEPWQIKQKFPEVYVAVDTNRRHGIERLMNDEATKDVEVILSDDAYQHRYVKPGYNILLVDYHRLISDDRLLPAGRLRERPSASRRATTVIVTKCPQHINAMGFRVIMSSLNLRPYQQLFFSTFSYGTMHQLWGDDTLDPEALRKDNTHVLLLTGVALCNTFRRSRFPTITTTRNAMPKPSTRLSTSCQSRTSSSRRRRTQPGSSICKASAMRFERALMCFPSR